MLLNREQSGRISLIFIRLANLAISPHHSVKLQLSRIVCPRETSCCTALCKVPVASFNPFPWLSAHYPLRVPGNCWTPEMGKWVWIQPNPESTNACSHQTELFLTLRSFIGITMQLSWPHCWQGCSLLILLVPLVSEQKRVQHTHFPDESADTLNKLRSKFPFTWIFLLLNT